MLKTVKILSAYLFLSIILLGTIFHTLNIHTHIINGQVIVHSHSSTKKDKTDYHTIDELLKLEGFNNNKIIVDEFEFQILEQEISIFRVDFKEFYHKKLHLASLALRAPPKF